MYTCSLWSVASCLVFGLVVVLAFSAPTSVLVLGCRVLVYVYWWVFVFWPALPFALVIVCGLSLLLLSPPPSSSSSSSLLLLLLLGVLRLCLTRCSASGGCFDLPCFVSAFGLRLSRESASRRLSDCAFAFCLESCGLFEAFPFSFPGKRRAGGFLFDLTNVCVYALSAYFFSLFFFFFFPSPFCFVSGCWR